MNSSWYVESQRLDSKLCMNSSWYVESQGLDSTLCMNSSWYVGSQRLDSKLCMDSSWYVESQRLDSKPSMNNLWMVPQFALLGIAKVLVEDGMDDVFYSHLEISMHLWAPSFIPFVEGLGNLLGAVLIVVLGKWVRDDINESRLDKYYFLLAMLTILAILFFMYLRKFYAPKIKPKKDDKEGPKKDDKEATELRQLEEGKNFSRSHSPHPTESPAESTSKSSSNRDSSVVERSSFYPDQPSNPAEIIHFCNNDLLKLPIYS
ncbi:hypothetical protein SLA2020_194100 [Shorea laevis]